MKIPVQGNKTKYVITTIEKTFLRCITKYFVSYDHANTDIGRYMRRLCYYGTVLTIYLNNFSVITVQQGIYIIMGANIGTSITSSIVALTQVADKNTFRRAFASSMLLYMFNLITCVILLPLEYFTGYLYEITKLCVQGINVEGGSSDSPQFLKVITQPLIKLIIEV